MHLYDINPCQNLYSSVLKLLIHFFLSSELATPAPTISTTKQRPDVISSTYTESHLSTNNDLNEESGKNNEKRQPDEEGITSQSFGTIVIFLLSSLVSLCSVAPSPFTSHLIAWERRGPDNKAEVVSIREMCA